MNLFDFNLTLPITDPTWVFFLVLIIILFAPMILGRLHIPHIIGMILAVVFVVRGIIIPIAHHVAGGGSSDQTVQAQADTEEVQANSDAAVRQPLKGKSDTDKIAAMTAGWHEDANGKWYQNTDGTYFSNGFQDIDGVTYSFDENGYIQTGWVEKGVKLSLIHI